MKTERKERQLSSRPGNRELRALGSAQLERARGGSPSGTGKTLAAEVIASTVR